jgi:phosphoribosyl 1,2-cyclic phosphate phosphodiesterase
MTTKDRSLKITFLGTGTSQGIPVINCDCNVCVSDNPHNKRLRTSVIIQSDNTSILIDTSTDLRQQLLRNPISSLDAVIYTHAHADHVCGIDDLRPFNFSSDTRIPVYANQNTLDRLTNSFDYAFGNGRMVPGVPNLKAIAITGQFKVNELDVFPLELWHGNSIVFGYRINNFAYCTDVNKIPEHTYEQMNNLDVLVLDALREKPHPTHLSVQEAIEIAQKIDAKKTFLIHMSHNIDHEIHGKILPENINFAYDGLSIELGSVKSSI